MIREIGRGVTARNPVWVAPLALPIVIFASTTWEMTFLFAIALVLTVTITHMIAVPLERWLPPDLAVFAVLVVAGVVITLAERIMYAAGLVLPTRPLLLFRAISVSGVMLWPVLVGRREESFSTRMNRVLGLVIGFALGLLLLSVIRIPFISIGLTPANSVAFALILLALGRMAVNQFMIVRKGRGK